MGHSTGEIGNFVSVLKRYCVDVATDVKLLPYDCLYSQFNYENLAGFLC